MSEIMERPAEVEVLSLDELTATLRREHDLVVYHGSQAIIHAIACGEACLAIKAILPHGEFLSFLAMEGYKVPTIQQYMRVARHQGIVLRYEPPTIKDALRLLAGAPSTANQPPEIVAEVKRLRSEGASFRRIQEETGLGHTAATNILNPEAAERRRRGKYHRSMVERRKLTTESRDKLAKRTGGGYSEAYSLIRRTAQILDRLTVSADEQEIRRILSAATGSLHSVEDHLVKAMKTRAS